MSFTVVFGFRTPSVLEIPTVLYLGADADRAWAAINASTLPRISMITNPMLLAREVRHWSETVAKDFEDEHGEKLGAPNVPPPVEVRTEGAMPSQQNLEDLTVHELKEIAASKGVDLKGATHKADIILEIYKHDAIAAGNLDVLTVDELKELGAEKGVDLKGVTHKADIIAAIKAAG